MSECFIVSIDATGDGKIDGYYLVGGPGGYSPISSADKHCDNYRALADQPLSLPVAGPIGPDQHAIWLAAAAASNGSNDIPVPAPVPRPAQPYKGTIHLMEAPA